MKLTFKATRKNCLALARFYEHRLGAKKRGIPFLMTFAEWEWLWLASGKWEQRGNKGHQFVMSRNGPDIGPYAPWNVVIKTQVENRREAKTVWSVQSRKRQSEAQKGKSKSEQMRKKLSEANKARGAKPPARFKPVEVEGVRYRGLGDAAAVYGVTRATLRKRLNAGQLRHRFL